MHIRKNPIANGCAAYSTREYTVDNPINRLILAAWQYICRDPVLGKTARQITQGQPDLYVPIRELNSQLNSPHLDHRQASRVMRDASRPITHHMHMGYEQVRKTALMLLRHIGPEQDAERSSSRISGMLFPMDSMWEFFLEDAVLSFPKKNWKLSAQESLGVLIPEGGGPMRRMKPDFLLYQKDPMDAAAVLDAKYKAIWGKAYEQLPTGTRTVPVSDEEDEEDNDSPVYDEKDAWKDSRIREDSFQVMSYMHVTRSKTGSIVFPAASEQTILPIKRLRLYAGTEDSMLLIPVSLPKTTEDFPAYCAEMDERCRLLREQLQTILLPDS